MKLPFSTLDKIILLLLSVIFLVDMINGFFMLNGAKLPISQSYKLIVVLLMLSRLLVCRDILFVILIFSIFQLAPIAGFIKTGNLTAYYDDVVVGAKWFNVPLSFFYFKNLFQSNHFEKIEGHIHLVIKTTLFFLTLNMLLGALGFGSAFYFEGYGNAVGTKGFINGGNELTISVLALGFIVGCYLKLQERYKAYFLCFGIFMFFSFLITSKTVLAGVILVFAIPWITDIKLRFKKKWLDRILFFSILGIPVIAAVFYFGVINSGALRKIQNSIKVNEGDILTILLSNRNVALEDGWKVFMKEYSWLENVVGLGRSYFLGHTWRSPELDFFSVLFIAGVIGLLMLLLLLLYWFLNAKRKIHAQYAFAKQVFLFLIFLILIANTAGHVFGSGIAGIYIGLAIALMFYRELKEKNVLKKY